MECRLPMVRDDMDTRERDGFLAQFSSVPLMLGSLLLLTWLGAAPLAAIAIAFVVMLVGRSGIRRMLPDWAWSEDIVGAVVLTSGSVRTEGVSVQEMKVDHTCGIQLSTNHIQGRGVRYKDIQRNGLGTLRVTRPDGSLRVVFVVKDTHTQQLLLDVLKEWYRGGMEVHESNGENNSGVFLLRWDWNYSDLKREKAGLMSGAPGTEAHQAVP